MPKTQNCRFSPKFDFCASFPACSVLLVNLWGTCILISECKCETKVKRHTDIRFDYSTKVMASLRPFFDSFTTIFALRDSKFAVRPRPFLWQTIFFFLTFKTLLRHSAKRNYEQREYLEFFVNTCGRHCAVRIRFRNYEQREYLELFKKQKYTPDQLVTLLTYFFWVIKKQIKNADQVFKHPYSRRRYRAKGREL